MAQAKKKTSKEPAKKKRVETMITLRELIVAAGGWPFNVAKVAALLKKADVVLAGNGGRAFEGGLTKEEFAALNPAD